MVIQINNKRITDFCNKHPSFDIESTVLSFIDFIEETYSSVIPSLDSTLASQILTNMKALEQKVQMLDQTIANKQMEYFNKTSEMKKEYIDNVKDILMINNNEKIVPIIKEYNEAFINKLSLLFKEMIPKEHQSQTYQLESFLKNIEHNIVIEMNKGITKESIDSMLAGIDQKFANILTHSEQKITNVLSAVSQNKQDDTILHTKLDRMLDNLGKTTKKGKISENMLNFNLQAVYPTADIRNVSNTPHAGDFWILRKDKNPILVENKNFDDTVQAEDVQKFINDINTQNMSGIMISQKSKIVFRDNYEIEIHNGNVAVYIHECEYDPYKIKIAVQIIDTFKSKIEKQKIENGTTFTIDIDILEKINKEFQLFNIKKTQHLSEIKNMCDTLTKSAEDMEFNALDQLLESHGLLTNIKKFICGSCPRTFKTQKGLDTHERQCQGDTENNSKKKGIKCEYCEEIAKTPKGLRSHCRKKHNIDIDNCSETSSDN
jgi:hypothetical protein